MRGKLNPKTAIVRAYLREAGIRVPRLLDELESHAGVVAAVDLLIADTRALMVVVKNAVVANKGRKSLYSHGVTVSKEAGV